MSRRAKRLRGDGSSASGSSNRPTFNGLSTRDGSHELTLPTTWSSGEATECHAQEQCPLFSRIPGEIRNTIFELACHPCDDPKWVYKHTDYFYRPGYHAKHKTYTALLQTCRRIWIEANDLPMKFAVHTFWFNDKKRRPGWVRIDVDEGQRFREFWDRLTPTNCSNLQSIRFFTQMYWLEHNDWRRVLNVKQHTDMSRGALEMIFTIKHTDWWHWENDNALSMSDDWIMRFLAGPASEGVRKFKLELETLDLPSKLAQLQEIIERIKSKHSQVGVESQHTSTWKLRSDAGKEILRWTRPGNVDGEAANAHQHLTDLNYRVFSLEWDKR